MREEFKQKYNQLLLSLNKNDLTCDARKYWHQNKTEEYLDAIDSLETKKKMCGKKENFMILKQS